jgi:cobalt/nickel transport system permease protein
VHIPDGYLSLETSLPAFGVMIPVWAAALKKLKKVLDNRQIPLLSMCAAFSFVIMMFNIPLGGSSIHAVGAVFIAVLIGPWASCIAVSVAIIIQALVFGDGGIAAIGVNCFNMAVVMPFSGYYTYRAIAGKSEISSGRSMSGIFTGSFIGINLAALCAAVEFGVQPLLFKAADGHPLYGYFPLSVSVPAMMFEHLLFAGPIEGIITAAAYLARYAPQLLGKASGPAGQPVQTGASKYKAFMIGLVILVILTPVGLLATGTAWGEWGTDILKEKIGYIPQGFAKLSEIWRALMPGYSIHGLTGSFFKSSIGYVSSAVIGIILIAAIMFTTERLVIKNKKGNKKIGE